MSEPSGTLASEVHRVGGVITTSIAQTFPDHLPMYACSVLFTACTYIVALCFHAPLDLGSSAFILEMGGQCLTIGVTIVVLMEFIKLIRGGFPDAPARILCMHLLRWFGQGDRPGNLFHSLVALSMLAVSFTTLKEAIPQIHPFSWDLTFMQWDRIIGFGRLPWEILQPVLGYAPVTTAINFAYDIWFFVMFGCLFWQAFSAKRSVLRLQFLLAFSFAWFIGGNLLAMAFSSAGPCFYGFLHPGHDPYAAQMAYLHAINRNWPIFSVNVQNLLWSSYSAGHGTLGGISAMPSLHVVIAVLMAIWGWHVNRVAGWTLSVFAVVIVIGSVHLAWHYAVDGIAGAGLAVLFWVAAGAVARASEHYRMLRRAPVRDAAPSASRA